ncbi:MAG: C40 family peptidase [Proteobacteria bacterium]|nr:C40 family peptidase [Pseudomonadota bacterium]
MSATLAAPCARRLGWLVLAGLGGLGHLGCARVSRRAGAALPPCPAEAPGPPLTPGTAPQHELAEFWLGRYPAALDQPLLDAAAREAHNTRVAALRAKGRPVGRWEVRQRPVDRRALRADLERRLQRLEQAFREGSQVAADGLAPQALRHELRRRLDHYKAVDELRVVHRSTALRCLPTEARVVEAGSLPDFDLLQCSQLRFGESVRVVAHAGRFAQVWSSYATGWAALAALSAPLTSAQAERYLRPQRSAIAASDNVPLWSQPAGGALIGLARLGLRLVLAEDTASGVPAGALDATPRPMQAVTLPTAGGTGLRRGWIASAALAPQPNPLTVRSLFRRAFALLHQPYGWGGTDHRRDCSRLLMDLFASFGLDLPRASAQQAAAGTEQLEVAGWAAGSKASAIVGAARRGLVLLYLPGHVMLYVGRAAGQLYALHTLSGYLAPCPAGGETMWRINRTAVTTLALGRRSSRRSLLERITRLVIFAPAQSPPDPSANPAAVLLPARSPAPDERRGARGPQRGSTAP